MRYIPNTPEDRELMLREIGVSTLEDLLKAIPDSLRLKRPINLPAGKSEWEVKSHMVSLARKNINTTQAASFLGAGSYDHYVPSAISAIAGRSEYTTAYTPYQPEVAQGTLQVIYEFQSMICELFAMPASNASVYDGGTSLAEAVLLARVYTKRNKVLWPKSVHPHYRKVAKTISTPQGMKFEELPVVDGKTAVKDLEAALTEEVAAVVFQYPNFFGVVEEIEPLIKAVHAKGALAIIVADPIAMGVLEAPGNFGADIVIGEGQSLGNPQSFGGPYLGLFSVQDKLVRNVPGRIVGVTKDVDGNRGFVLTLQTREQHIRRDKATSNICTNEGLCAARATMYMALIGPKGLKEIGEACMARSTYLKSELKKINGIDLPMSGPNFKEFVIRIPGDTGEFLKFMTEKCNILAGVPLKRFGMGMDDCLLVATTEIRTQEELDGYIAGVKQYMAGRK
jgi:glycine dehydrogenase subunit 1